MSKTAKETEFIKSAKIHMTEFEINGFKRTYPSLFRTIMDAMESYHASKLSEVKDSNKPEIEKINKYLKECEQTIAKKDEELNKAKEEIERLKGEVAYFKALSENP